MGLSENVLRTRLPEIEALEFPKTPFSGHLDTSAVDPNLLNISLLSGLGLRTFHRGCAVMRVLPLRFYLPAVFPSGDMRPSREQSFAQVPEGCNPQ